jgi:ATP-dependent DNA helicase RecQ
VTRILNYLTDIGELRAEGRNRRLFLTMVRPSDALVEVAELEERRKAYLDSRIDMMRRYAETASCRRQELLAYFGEAIDPCGNCDTCVAGLPDSAEVEAPSDPESPVAIEHNKWGTGTVVSSDGPRATVLFETVGYKTIDMTVALEGDVVEIQNDDDAEAST